jgi:hypothetical protein
MPRNAVDGEGAASASRPPFRAGRRRAGRGHPGSWRAQSRLLGRRVWFSWRSGVALPSKTASADGVKTRSSAASATGLRCTSRRPHRGAHDDGTAGTRAMTFLGWSGPPSVNCCPGCQCPRADSLGLFELGALIDQVSPSGACLWRSRAQDDRALTRNLPSHTVALGHALHDHHRDVPLGRPRADRQGSGVRAGRRLNAVQAE